jgi:1-phosphatidylinositol phosphodiesterase
MGAGFNIQIVNATPYIINKQKSDQYQMEWNPSSQILPNSLTQFYAEFKETIGTYSIDDSAYADYTVDGVSNFQFTIRAQKKGVDNLSTPVPSEAGYGVLVEWSKNLPNDFWVYPTPNYGSGGLDDDLTALKPSVKFWANKWMELFAPCIQNLHLNESTLPGTHDAGTYKASGITQPWVQTQYLDINEQLSQGVRALDLRLIIGNGSGDNRFEICHGTYTFELKLVDVLNQVNYFLTSTSKEIIILDLHIFQGTWTTQDYQDVSNLIIKTIGTNKLIPPSGISQTLQDIWNTSGRVVVGAREFNSDMSGWIEQNTPFWDSSVKQFWCGTSVTTWSSVSSYLQQQIDQVSQPKAFFWSLMAQYNYIVTGGVPGVPANVPQELSKFFTGLNGIKSNIIATDWWNRVNSNSGQTETSIPNFSALINAVPLNILKGYRRQNNLPLW